MTINIILVGKTKEKEIAALQHDFITRSIPFFDINLIYVKEEVIKKGDFAAQREIVIIKEGVRILEKIPKKTFVIALDEKGKQYSSEEFAYLLSDWKSQNIDITFIIGGCYGLTKQVKERARLLLSFSKMTLTHELIRIFLLEQLYRGFCIINGKRYHY
jgi:23S rRNA (pseudouridine1915-N3)-methyltransferase